MAERDPEVVQRFVEQFASALLEAGIPRMPARVFAALHSVDSGRLTAAEIAEILQVSPAAVSGAVRYLTQFSLIRRERAPGSRRDHYVADNDAWYEATFSRDRIMIRWRDSAQAGVTALGPETPAGKRMAETAAFFEFLQEELSELAARWQKIKTERRTAEQD